MRQAPPCVHDDVPHPVLPEADIVRHDSVAVHPTTGVFPTDAEGGPPPRSRWLRGRVFSSRRFVLEVDKRDVRPAETLGALLWRPTAARWPGLPRQRCPVLLRGVACRGVAQAAPVTRLRDHKAGGARVTRLLAPGRVWWRFGSGRAGARTCGAIRPHRGGGSSVRRVRLEPRGTRGGGASRQPCGVGSGLMHHGLPPVPPVVRPGWPHPQERSLAPLAGDAVSRRSASRAVWPRVWAADRGHRSARGDSCGLAHQSCGQAWRSPEPARHGVVRLARRLP